MEGPEPNGVIAVFETREAVDRALDWLHLVGVERVSVSILGPGLIQEIPSEMDRTPAHQAEVASYWAKWGAGLGALAGVGPVSIALAAAAVGMGPMATVVAVGLGTVAVTASVGAVSAGLIGAGVHSEHAKDYERALRDGKFLLVVHTDDASTLRAAREEFERLGASSMDTHGLTGREPRPKHLEPGVAHNR